MKNLRKARTLALSFTSFILSAAVLMAVIVALAAGNKRLVTRAAPPLPLPAKAKKTMRSFASDEELKAYLKKLADEQRRGQRREAAKAVSDSAAPGPATTANQAGLAKAGEGVKDESITNTQHA